MSSRSSAILLGANASLMRLTLCIGLVLIVSQLMKASVTGTILGFVEDSSGAVVAGAEVSLRNPSIGINRKTTTDQAGNYQFLDVPVASDYRIEVVGAGFKKVVQTNVVLLVNQNYRADFHLQVGSLEQTVDVSGNPIQVETTSTQVGDVIESDKIQAIPLNGRNYLEQIGRASCRERV